MLSGPRDVPEREETVTSQGMGMTIRDAFCGVQDTPKSLLGVAMCVFMLFVKKSIVIKI